MCGTTVKKIAVFFARMGFFACPCTLFSMSFEAVSDLMKRLITDPRYRRGHDGNFYHYHVPCSHLQVYVSWYVPPFFAGDITSTVNDSRSYVLQ
jgi:hypothetical protein